MDWKPTSEPPEDWHLTDNLHAEHGKGDPFAAAIRATRMSMLITDPRQPDNPIVFANKAFLKLTGYERDEVVGRNCRFLQGSETDPRTIDRLREAIASRQDIHVDILNYRKDGTPFWNALFMSPVTNEAGELQFFFASQIDVSERKDSELAVRADKDRFESAVQERTAQLQTALEAQKALLHEVDHRVKNNLQMISSLIVMQSRSIPDPAIRESLRSMLERVEALSTVHRRLYQSDDVTQFDIADFVRDLVTDLVAANGRDDLTVSFDLEPIDIKAERAAPVALMVNELVTNALKHAFNGRGGNLGIRVAERRPMAEIEIRDNGHGLNGANGDGSFGMKLIGSLSRQLRAKVDWVAEDPGTRVTISLPLDPTELQQ
jgi:PAS domain S-box-containing protein